MLVFLLPNSCQVGNYYYELSFHPLDFYLDLSEANLMRIIHPNNLFFCLGFRNNEVSVSHYVLGDEKLGVAQEGLYVMRDKESGPIHSE